MQSRLRLGGNAVQPLLLMFPLGLFAVAVMLDLASLLGAPAVVGTVAYWHVVAGLAGGVLAVLAGAFDTPARVLVLLLDLGVLFFFAVLALIRVRSGDRLAEPGLFLLEVAGLAAAFAGSWRGGRLNPQEVS
jgi:uncharacterized membrane protein